MSVEYNYKHTYLSFIIAIVLSVYFVIKHVWIYIISAFVLLVCCKFLKKLFNPKFPLEGKAVLMTGCDTGKKKKKKKKKKEHHF